MLPLLIEKLGLTLVLAGSLSSFCPIAFPAQSTCRLRGGPFHSALSGDLCTGGHGHSLDTDRLHAQLRNSGDTALHSRPEHDVFSRAGAGDDRAYIRQ